MIIIGQLLVVLAVIAGQLTGDRGKSGAKSPGARKRSTPSKFKKIASPQFHRELLRQNQQALPSAIFKAHRGGVCTIETGCVSQKSTTGQRNGIYGAKLANSVRDLDDPLKFREKTDVACMVRKKCEDGSAMKVKPDSIYNWELFAIFHPAGEITEPIANQYVDNFVSEWNMHGVNLDVFEYRSEITAEKVTEEDLEDLPTLDQTIIDKDGILIIKAIYGIESNLELLELKDEEEILTEFFSTFEAGVAAINKFVTGSSVSRRGNYSKNKK